jgi:hypothetical protein
MSDYSRLLTKMAELKAIEGEYRDLTNTYKPAASTDTDYTDNTFDKYTLTPNENAISDTKTPLVIRPGEDYGEFWKYIGKVVPVTMPDSNAQKKNSQNCWNMAANDPRLFQKVAYTGTDGTNLGQPDWDNRCYGLTPNAPASGASYNTNSPGYSHMVGNGDSASVPVSHNIYTKIGIKPSSSTSAADVSLNIAKASKLADIQYKVDYLTREIAAASGAGINSELNSLVGSAASSTDLINKINQYMNNSVSVIDASNGIIKKRKEMNNVYAEINEQTTLRARKYKFIFYIVIVLSLIIGYASYTSKLSLLEQIDKIKNYAGWGWWTNWWVLTIVVVVFILSSFGWDMKGNILMVIRYLTDPEFWTGQLWWVGVTFLLLIIIFFYATFKSFFMSFDAGLKNIQSSLDGDESG